MCGTNFSWFASFLPQHDMILSFSNYTNTYTIGVFVYYKNTQDRTMRLKIGFGQHYDPNNDAP